MSFYVFPLLQDRLLDYMATVYIVYTRLDSENLSLSMKIVSHRV